MMHNALPEIANSWIALSTSGSNSDILLAFQSLFQETVFLGQSYDIFTNVQKSWNHFVSSGQAVAFVLGIVVGWFFKGIFP